MQDYLIIKIITPLARFLLYYRQENMAASHVFPIL